jgi:flagellar protein FlgJ
MWLLNIKEGEKLAMSINIESNSQYLMARTMAADKSSIPTTDEELMEVCKSFEAYFFEQAMKGMEKTIPTEGKKNPYLEQFGDMLYQEYAKSATKNQGLGMAQMLYESMKRNG